MGTHSCSSGPMQLTDSELRFGLFADAREKKRKKISPAPETIQSLSLLLVGRDESLLSWKVGHSVQACWAFTHNIHRVLHHSTKHRIGINVVSVSFRVTCSQLKEPTEIIHLIRDTTRTVGWSRWAARFRGKALLWHPYWKLLPYLDWYLSTHLHLCCRCYFLTYFHQTVTDMAISFSQHVNTPKILNSCPGADRSNPWTVFFCKPTICWDCLCLYLAVLGSGTKTARLGFGKDRVLAQNTCFWCHKQLEMSRRCINDTWSNTTGWFLDFLL